ASAASSAAGTGAATSSEVWPFRQYRPSLPSLADHAIPRAETPWGTGGHGERVGRHGHPRPGPPPPPRPRPHPLPPPAPPHPGAPGGRRWRGGPAPRAGRAEVAPPGGGAGPPARPPPPPPPPQARCRPDGRPEAKAP